MAQSAARIAAPSGPIHRSPDRDDQGPDAPEHRLSARRPLVDAKQQECGALDREPAERCGLIAPVRSGNDRHRALSAIVSSSTQSGFAMRHQ